MSFTWTLRKTSIKSTYIIENLPEGLVGTLKIVSVYFFFQNVRKLLLIGATSKISFSKAEEAVLGIRN